MTPKVTISGNLQKSTKTQHRLVRSTAFKQIEGNSCGAIVCVVIHHLIHSCIDKCSQDVVDNARYLVLNKLKFLLWETQNVIYQHYVTKDKSTGDNILIMDS